MEFSLNVKAFAATAILASISTTSTAFTISHQKLGRLNSSPNGLLSTFNGMKQPFSSVTTSSRQSLRMHMEDDIGDHFCVNNIANKDAILYNKLRQMYPITFSAPTDTTNAELSFKDIQRDVNQIYEESYHFEYNKTKYRLGGQLSEEISLLQHTKKHVLKKLASTVLYDELSQKYPITLSALTDIATAALNFDNVKRDVEQFIKEGNDFTNKLNGLPATQLPQKISLTQQAKEHFLAKLAHLQESIDNGSTLMASAQKKISRGSDDFVLKYRAPAMKKSKPRVEELVKERFKDNSAEMKLPLSIELGQLKVIKMQIEDTVTHLERDFKTSMNLAEKSYCLIMKPKFIEEALNEIGFLQVELKPLTINADHFELGYLSDIVTDLIRLHTDHWNAGTISSITKLLILKANTTSTEFI